MRDVTAPEFFEWCRVELSEILERPIALIDAETRFRRLALDSAMAIRFILALEEWLDVELDGELLASYPTAGALADHLLALRRGHAE